MGMFDFFKPKKVKKARDTSAADAWATKPEPVKKTPKELANEKGEPWVSVLNMEINADNISEGNFELDFNDIFVARLIKSGYRGNNDFEIVDQWFSTVCRNIALETFEQELADPDKRAEWNARTNKF